MPDIRDVIEQLIAKRAELQAELGGVDQSIKTLTSLLASIEQGGVKVDRTTSESSKEANMAPQRERGILPPSEIANLARGTLLRNGRPMKRGDLVRKMESDGVPMPGRDKAKNLGTILWRHIDDFVSLEKLGYWPRDVAIKGVYDPTKPPDGIVSQKVSSP